MKYVTFFLSLCLITLLSVTSDAAQTIKLGVVTKPGSAQNIVADKFKELIEARSNGELKVKIFHSGSIGNETEILQQIQMGTIELGVITSGPFDSFDPIVRVIDYPFLFKDSEQADAILDGVFGTEILTSLESSGFKGLCFSENGFRNLTNSRKPVTRPDDINGLKIRVMSSALHQEIWRALGANPTPMPWPIYTELEQGVIDGQENPLWVLEVYKFYEIQKYMTLTRHVYSAHIDVASLVWWNSLDVKTQEMVKTAMFEAAKYQRADNRAGNNARLKLLKDNGMQVEERPDVKAFRAQVQNLQDIDLFKDPKVHSLLIKVIEATK
jgi:tripartite ATP-independent transporter DctP family solute receptor